MKYLLLAGLAIVVSACNSNGPSFTSMNAAELAAFNRELPPEKHVYCVQEADTSTYIRRSICRSYEDWVALNERAAMTLDSMPSKNQIKRVADSFNKKISQLDSIKSKLSLNEVLSIPSELKDALEDNNLNRHFSYMDKFGIYHSLNLSRLDLRGLNLHSGDDRRTTSDKDRETNKHKDERADLRGAHIVGSDISERELCTHSNEGNRH